MSRTADIPSQSADNSTGTSILGTGGRARHSMDADVERAVYALVAQQFSDDTETVGGALRFVDDLGADSAAVAELLTAVETRFGIDLTEEPAGLTNVRTVDD